MVCKYCHLNGHLIDKCPTIICKNCKEVGHPQWLCKLKKNKIKELKTNNINNSNKIETIKKTNNINLESKYSFTDEIKKKENKNDIVIKNISYYIKIQKHDWGNLVTI
jgi:hypothetical protein